MVGFVVCLLALAGCTSGSDSETAKAESPKPGGTLYVEIHRRMGRDVPWELRRYAATVERAGFRQVEAFWNWPNFTRCTKILPIDDASALGNIVVNNRRGPLAWLMLNATRLGFYLGVVGWTARCLSLLARRETP